MNCTNCEDTGLRFDTFEACTECALGKPIQNKYDKEELNRILKRANTLRIRIKQYSNIGDKHEQRITK